MLAQMTSSTWEEAVHEACQAPRQQQLHGLP